jgi:hypothetical protein
MRVLGFKKNWSGGRPFELHSVALTSETRTRRFPAFLSVWCSRWVVSAVLDDSLLEERQDNPSVVFIEQANDVAEG